MMVKDGCNSHFTVYEVKVKLGFLILLDHCLKICKQNSVHSLVSCNPIGLSRMQVALFIRCLKFDVAMVSKEAETHL